MGTEGLKVVKIFCTDQLSFDIVTRMPEKEIIAELEATDRDTTWIRLEGCTMDTDDRTPFAMHRNILRSYIIVPHRRPEPQVVRPGPGRIVQ